MTACLLDPSDQTNAPPPAESSQPAAAQRILHVINGEHYAGAERVQDLLAGRLLPLGFEVGFACVKPERFAELRHFQAAPLYELPMRRRIDLRVVRRLARIIREEKYVLLHAHSVRSALIGRMAAAMAGVPMICHVHSPTSRDTTSRWRNYLNTVADRFSTRGATRLIAVSASLGRHLRERGFSDSQIRVVPNGVPAPESLPDRSPPADTWTLGTVALFRPRKGLEVLLDALWALRSEGANVRLRAVGTFETPEYEAQIRQHVSQLQLEDAIDWTGFTSDVPSELARMDVFVLPSLFGEGLPMVILEAMAHGVPVVAASVEGIPEAIRDGQDGLLTKPGDAADLTAVLARILSGEACWAALRRSALERHADVFSDVAMAAGVAAVYREILPV